MKILSNSFLFLVVKVLGFQFKGTKSFATSGINATGLSATKGISSTSLHDSMTDTESGRRDIFRFHEVTSTMDKAREIAASVGPDLPFAVIAERQTKGRGTRGRTWLSGANNLYLTLSIPMKLISTPLTLTPLRIGTIIRPSVASRIQDGSSAYVKWPNDVLIEDKKVCGVLIEIDDNRMIVGIGCNIGSAPSVDTSGPQAGRPSTCLANHNEEIKNIPAPPADEEVDNISLHLPHHEMAGEIFERVKEWLSSTDTADQVIEDFQAHMDYRQQKLRNTYVSEEETNNQVCVDPSASELDVIPLGINRDGTLQVRFVRTGLEKALIADYLY